VSKWIDDVCGYRLPWGYNILSIHLKHIAEQNGVELPSVCDHFSTLVKYGVHEPSASWLLTFGVRSRAVSLRVSDYFPLQFTDPKSLLEWLQGEGIAHLRSEGLDLEAMTEIEDAIGSFDRTARRAPKQTTSTFIPKSESTNGLEHKTRLLLLRGSLEPKMTFDVYRLNGEHVGSYEYDEPHLLLWKLIEFPELVNAVVDLSGNDERNGYVTVIVSSV